MLATAAVLLLLSAEPDSAEDLEPPFGHAAGAVTGAFVGTLITISAGVAAFFVVELASGGWPVGNSQPAFQGAVVTSLCTYALGDLLLVSGAAWFGHDKGAGRGTWPAALVGSAIGMTVGAGLIAAGYLSIGGGTGPLGFGPLAALCGLAAIVVMAAPVVGLELSNAALAPKWVWRRRPAVGSSP
jgi:hypothetical protein